jgi:uncharacterized coiled-coil protein SlyX
MNEALLEYQQQRIDALESRVAELELEISTLNNLITPNPSNNEEV